MPNAQEIALKYMSPRYKRLDRLEQYYDGTQYQGRSPFLALDQDAPPLMERAPCVVDGIAKTAIGDLISFMMGEDRYPHVSSGSAEDDDDVDASWGLNKEDSAKLERWINGPLTVSAKLQLVFPEALTMAMKAKSVALVASIRRGYPCLMALPAKWCTPTFNPSTGSVVKLVVQYPYIVEEPDPQERGKWVEKCKIYRRVIDEVTDTVYLPGDGREDGTEPSWAPDPAQTVEHKMGFCPVVWYAFDRSEPTAANYDGKAIHETLDDEQDALNFSKSMNHRAALYTGDPQMYETGVDEMTQVAPQGNAPRISIDPDAMGPDGKRVGVFTSMPMRARRGIAMRRKGPGVVWRYPDPTSKVGILSLPGDALDGIALNSESLRQLLAESMSVVLINPAEVKAMGALSGKALAFLFARQIARADKIRMEAGDNLILAAIDLLLRMCLTVDAATKGGLRIPGVEKVLPLLTKSQRDVQTGVRDEATGQPATAKEWFGPRLTLEWGPYFEMSPEEENFLVTLCTSAYTGGLMPLEVVLEKLRSVFSFGSVSELVKQLEEAKAKAAKEEATKAETAAQTSSKYAQGQPDGPPWPPDKVGSASGAKGDKKA